METAKIFTNGGSQAVRLPKEFRFNGDEVLIRRLGQSVLLIPREAAWDTFLEGLEGFSEDFMADGRGPLPVQQRESL